MRKKIRLTEKHPVHKKVCQVFDLMDELGIRFFIVRNGEIMVKQEGSCEEFFLLDLEENDSIDNRSPYDLPPAFDWKIAGEREVEE